MQKISEVKLAHWTSFSISMPLFVYFHQITTRSLVLAIVATENDELHQMYVKTAFLDGDLNEGFSLIGQNAL